MAGVGDAVRYGLVASLAHPGGNVTGITLITQDVTAKALELLKEVVPQRKHIGFLWNAGLPFSDVILGEAQTAGIHLAGFAVAGDSPIGGRRASIRPG